MSKIRNDISFPVDGDITSNITRNITRNITGNIDGSELEGMNDVVSPGRAPISKTLATMKADVSILSPLSNKGKKPVINIFKRKANR